MAAMLEFRTQGFNPYAVKYSPYYDSRIAVASSANYGIVGNGRVFVLGLTAQGIQAEKVYDTNDALYDLAWSEINERQLVVATGDGSIKLFDVGVDKFPVMSFHEHKREVFSVNWNQVTKDVFTSSSWDGTVKIWSPTRTASLMTLPVGSCTYGASFSPASSSVLATASSDSHLRLYDLRVPVSAKYHLVASIPVHHYNHPPSVPGSSASLPGVPGAPPAEMLCLDWNKYRPTVVACAGVDRVVRVFDLRNASSAPETFGQAPPTLAPGASPLLSVLRGHEYAVRRLAWSPHAADVLISGGYDMTARVWTDGFVDGGGGAAAPARQLGVMNRHTEFVTGVDWCLFGMPGWVATTAWDERVLLWDANTFMRR